jgi:predicted aldo/keto reductase-like oxidoreductase
MIDSNSRRGRRAFLKGGMAGLAGTAFLPAILKGEPRDIETQVGRKAKQIIRPLGKTGIKLPIISIGAASYEPGLYKAALDRGVVHIDTSQYYYNGRHETLVGEVLKGRPRDSFVVATSVLLGNGAPGSYATFKKEDAPRLPEQCDVSLKRLGLDYVDIFYIASTGSRATALDGPLLAGLQKIKASGKARFIGVSTHNGQAEVIRAAAEGKIHDVVLTVLNFRMGNRADVKAAIAEASKAGLGVIVMKPMAGAFWDRERKQPINGRAALKWVLQDENVTTTVPGITTLDQLEADFSIMADPVLTAQEKTDLKLETGEAGAEGLFCAGCERCLDQCPAGLEIPTLMRSYMYAYGYRDLGRARGALDQAAFASLPCADCGTCPVRCAMGFDVKERAEDIARLRAVPEEFLTP